MTDDTARPATYGGSADQGLPDTAIASTMSRTPRPTDAASCTRMMWRSNSFHARGCASSSVTAPPSTPKTLTPHPSDIASGTTIVTEPSIELGSLRAYPYKKLSAD